MRTLKWTAIAGMTVALPLAAMFGFQRAAPEPKEESERAEVEATECRFTVGQRAAFRLESDVETVGKGAADAPRDHLSATLSWTVDGVESDAWRLRAQLTHVDFTQALSLPAERVRQSVDAPFEVRIDRRCRFVGFGYPTAWKPRTRQLVTSLLKTFEVVAPKQDEAEWTVEQNDGMGTFEARYIRGASSGEVVRHKIAYRRHPMADMVPVKVSVREARATARITGGWLASMTGEEWVSIEVADAVPVSLRQSFRLDRLDEVTPAVAAVSGLDWRDPYTLQVEDPPPAVDPAMKRARYGEVVDRFVGLRAQGPVKSLTAAKLLAKYLRAHPEDAKRLIDDIRAGTLALEARAAAFLALELAGTPEAVEALTVAVQDHQLTALDRSRATFALSEAGPLTLDTADVLERAAYDDSSEVLANSGLLALGSFGARTQEASEMRVWVRDSLRSAHEAAPGEGRRLTALDAMGNAGDPLLFDVLEAAMNDERATVRAHAAAALRRAAPDSAGSWLQARLEGEAHPRVQAELIRTLERFGPPSGAAIDVAGDLLAASDSPRVRKAVISWLGSAADSAPARDLLVAHFHVERDVGLLQLIGRFVPASAL